MIFLKLENFYNMDLSIRRKRHLLKESAFGMLGNIPFTFFSPPYLLARFQFPHRLPAVHFLLCIHWSCIDQLITPFLYVLFLLFSNLWRKYPDTWTAFMCTLFYKQCWKEKSHCFLNKNHKNPASINLFNVYIGVQTILYVSQ